MLNSVNIKISENVCMENSVCIQAHSFSAKICVMLPWVKMAIMLPRIKS